MQTPLITCKMRVPSLQSTLPTYFPQPNLVEKWCFYEPFVKLVNPKRYPLSRKLQLFHIRAQQSSGAIRFSSASVEATAENVDSKDEDVVFVAGATGRVGSRTVRELLKLGFRVRAGVRSAQRADSLVRSVKQMKLDTESTSGLQPIEKLEIVECDLEKRDQIAPALVGASVVICCIGASEKEVFDITGPYRIDYQATKNLIDAATAAKVNHFILLTSLGTNKFGFPAAILNLFWGVLCWKRKAEEALIASSLPYTIVRPGGMERPTDSYKETHNITLSEEDTLFGGQVSNLQVAELMAFMAQNRSLSYYKVVEVVAETTAPLTPMEQLLSKIPYKRDDISKPEKPGAAGRAESSTPKSNVAEAANIVEERESSEEKLAELEIATERLDPEPAKSSISEVPTALTGKETVEDRSVVPRPLSPYTAYDDLKPPSSPCPTAPSGQATQIETNDIGPGTTYTPVGVSEIDPGTPELAGVGLQKMQPLSPYAVYDDLKPPSSPCPTAPSGQATQIETNDVGPGTTYTPGGVSEVDAGTPELATVLSQKMQPLSPYAVYDDLKPPSSPCPTAPSGQETQIQTNDVGPGTTYTPGGVSEVDAGTPELAAVLLQKMQPLSPYAVYEDLKPPSSPSPSPPIKSSEEPLKASKTVDGVPTIIDGTLVDNISPEFTFCNSPFPVYDDLKPPTSPTPTAPISANVESQSMASTSGNGAFVEPIKTEEAGDEQSSTGPKTRPLSPYTMYDDMKPPSSPMPSPKDC